MSADPMDNGPRRWVEGARHSTPAHVAGILRAARKARRWSYRQAARHVGVSASHIARIEQGSRAPSTVTARRLAEVYELGPEEAATVIGAAVPGVGYDGGRNDRSGVPWPVVPAGQREQDTTDG